MNIKTAHFIIAGVVGLVSITFFGLGFLDSWQGAIVDRLLPTLNLDERVAVIGVDDSPVDLVTILGQFEAYKPNTVVFLPSIIDYIIDFSKDKKLKTLLESLSYKLILPVIAEKREKISKTLIESIEITKPPSFFNQFNQVSYGHPYFSTDNRVIVRSLPPVLTRQIVFVSDARGQAEYYQPIAYRAVIASHLIPVVPEPSDGLLIYPSGKIITHGAFSLSDLIYSPTNKDIFRNKIVFVGLTGTSSARTLSLPSRFSEMEDVDVQAGLASMLLQPRKIKPVIPIDRLSAIARILIASLIPAFSIWLFKPKRLIILLNVVIGVLYIIVTTILIRYGQLLPIIYLEMSWLLSLLCCFGYTYQVEKVREAHNPE